MKAWTSTHRCCPFGAVASVHAWERVGALLTHIARKCLKLAVLRYVDDFFGCERCVIYIGEFRAGSLSVIVRLETLEHAAKCLLRLVRLLLGPASVADHKVGWGTHLVVLGVEVSLRIDGYTCR